MNKLLLIVKYDSDVCIKVCKYVRQHKQRFREWGLVKIINYTKLSDKQKTELKERKGLSKIPTLYVNNTLRATGYNDIIRALDAILMPPPTKPVKKLSIQDQVNAYLADQENTHYGEEVSASELANLNKQVGRQSAQGCPMPSTPSNNHKEEKQKEDEREDPPTCAPRLVKPGGSEYETVIKDYTTSGGSDYDIMNNFMEMGLND